MQLYLDSYGAYLSIRNGMFAVRTRHAGEHSFAVRQVEAILLTRGTAMSTDAALLAVENDIPVLLIDADTHYPLAQVHSGKPGNIAAVRKNQALFARAPEGMAWAAAQVADKVAGQRALLSRWREMPDAPAEFVQDMPAADRVLAAMERELRRVGEGGPDAESLAGRIRGQEGTASRMYFQMVAKLVQARMPDFAGRQKRPAYDVFNALLNYLYGILYTQVHLGLLKAGLDPYTGILHADQYGGRPTLVYDAIEPYRPWADAVAVALALEGRIGPEAFEERENPVEGLWLSPRGKDVVIGAMLHYLEESTPFGSEGKMTRRSVQIDRNAISLVTFLKNWEG
jgi:CRISPR-associated protein Cas1